MKLKYTMRKITVGGEITFVPVDAGARFSGVLNVNETGEFLLERLTRDTTVDALVAAVAAEYEGEPNAIRREVVAFVEKLKQNELLTED